MNSLSKYSCPTDHMHDYGHDSPRSCNYYKFENAEESILAHRSFAFDRILYSDSQEVQVTPSAIYVPRQIGYSVIAIDHVDQIRDRRDTKKQSRWTRMLTKIKIVTQSKNLLIILKDDHGVRRIRAENTTSFKRAVEKAQSIKY